MSNTKFNKLLDIGGPMLLSALSLFITSLVIHIIGRQLDPTFHLLANRGLGKFTFSFLVIAQILLFLSVKLTKNFDIFVDRCIFFYRHKNWFLSFLLFFIAAFCLHSLILLFCVKFGFALYNPVLNLLSVSLILRILFGFFVTFLLAWSEELIFRGMLYSYFKQYLSPLNAITITSAIFMLAHDIAQPYNLLTRHWKLGLGLFLLGFMLNLIFEISKKLFIGMGVHAGLVSVKVLLRRLPLIVFLPKDSLPFWIRSDLRTSIFVHVLFIVVILILIKMHYKELTTFQDSNN